MKHTEGQINIAIECCCSSPRKCEECPLELLNDCQVQLRKDSGEMLFTYQAIVKRIENYVASLSNNVQNDINSIIVEEKSRFYN